MKPCMQRYLDEQKRIKEEETKKSPNKNSPNKKSNTPKKRPHKLTKAEYDDLRQIDWFPVDPYAD